MFSFAVKHLSETQGTGFTASRAMGSADIVGTGMKPVLKKYGIRTSYTVDEANGSDPYEVEAVFPKDTYSALDYTPVKSGYRFAGWSDGSELPYDAEVEYLESTGTQYIDLGFYPNSTTKMEVDGQFTKDVSTNSNTCGSNSTSGSGLKSFSIQYRSTGSVLMIGGYGVNNTVSDLKRHLFVLNGYGKSYIDSYGSNAANTFDNGQVNQTMVWFAYKGNTQTIERWANFRVYSIKVTQDGEVLRDLIPVRKNGIGHLFDRISNTLFGNLGTGSFLYGGDIPFTNLSSSDKIRYGLSNVYAVWQPPVTVTFDATTNGGAMPSGWVAPDYYGGQAYGTLPVPTKADNVFLGWFTATGERVLASTISPYTQHTLTARYAVPTYDTSFQVTTTSSYRKAGIYAANSRNTANPTIVDWGDGTTLVVYGNVSQLVHTYSSNGTFTVRVNNNISSFALSANDSTWYQTTTNNRYVVKKVTAIGSNVTSIPTYAFNYCSAMTDAVLPTGISSVPNYCFSYCQALTGITIPSNYTSIGSYAFQYCNSSSFTSITIPASITSIGSYAFSNCRYLKNIVFEASSTTLALNNYSFLNCCQMAVGSLDLSPRKITSIPNYCFQGWSYLTGITFPQGLTTIGQFSFRDCMFNAAVGSPSIVIPEGVTSIAATCFYSCYYLGSVSLPSTLTRIDGNAFANCHRLTTITSNRSTAPTVSSNTFGNSANYYTGRNSYSSGTNKLYVPAGATGYTSSYWGSVLLDSTKCGFTLENIQTYTVTFDANGGTGTMSPQTFTAGVAQNLTANAFTKEQYTFNGWNTAADGSGTSYSDEESYTATGDVILYAKWKLVESGGGGGGAGPGKT